MNPRPMATAIVEAYSEGDYYAYVSQVSARERTFAAAVAHIERLLPGSGRLLDVGTAAGAFLAAARSREWQVEGCEPNRWLARWGSCHYGIPIRTGEIFDHHFAPQSFDVVSLWDVIEHTPDPARVIRTAGELDQARRPCGRELPGHRQLDCQGARTSMALPVISSPVLLHARDHEEPAQTPRVRSG